MTYDPDYTRKHYDEFGLGEAERWDTSRFMQMQREVFRWHLAQRVSPGQRVLDAGCGAGVYTRQLVELGAIVTAFDISPVQLELCRVAAPGAAEHVEGSIIDLSRFEDDRFDVVLALGGALSYCFEQTPTALDELARVVRPGGMFGCSVMSLHGACHHFLPGVLADIETSRGVFRDGNLLRTNNRGHECHLFRPQELLALLAGAGFCEVELSAPAWVCSVWPDESLPEPGSEAWRFLLETELDAGRSCPAAGTHMIAWAIGC
jgi:SAM-dependent methyltransferase